jgi:hypothetical protein
MSVADIAYILYRTVTTDWARLFYRQYALSIDVWPTVVSFSEWLPTNDCLHRSQLSHSTHFGI